MDATLPGDVAVGTRGDLLLMNDKVAYVITEPDKGSTYYHYGGIVADAAALDGCEAGDDKLDEVGMILGNLDVADVAQSTLRAFRGKTAEVLADGSDGGPATVRVTGDDAPYWLVEYTLLTEAYKDDNPKPLSDPYGLDITVDYTLAPDSPVLQVDVTFKNQSEEVLSLLMGSLVSLAPTYDILAYSSSSLSIGGFNLNYGVPWAVATDGAGAFAYGVADGDLGMVSVSGINALVDITQALDAPIRLLPGQSDSRTLFLSIGATDGPSATLPLADANPAPLPGDAFSVETVSGTVTGPDGPVAGARVSLQASADGGDWDTLDRAYTDEDGAWTLLTPVFSEVWAFRVVAEADGRDPSDATEVTPGQLEVTLDVSEAGAVAYALTDQDGAPSPGRLHLVRDDGETVDLWLADSGTAAVAPGEWTYTLTRGYEYGPVEGDLSVPAGGEATLSATLEHLVDTTGWLSVDTHVHTSESPDSDITQADQLLHAAAHGLDIVVHTDHEHIVESRAIPAEVGLDAWVNNIIGEEVTAVIPEHLTMFPVEPDGSPRGGVIEWYQRDLGELFEAMHTRSDGGVNLLNHPSYLDLVGWDRATAAPTLDDPTLIGLDADADLWSWDFEGMEVMNGHRSPFLGGNARWDNWQSMLNAGAPLVAVGCSDDHGGDEVGFPRSYWTSSTDSPADYDPDELVAAFQEGRIQASAGAFARVTVDGAGLGELVTDTDGEADVEIEIQAIPDIDVTYLLVFANCDEVARLEATDPYGVVKLSEIVSVPIDGDTHVTIAAFGEERLPGGMPQFNPAGVPRVLTSPVYIDADGDGLWTAPGGRECAYSL